MQIAICEDKKTDAVYLTGLLERWMTEQQVLAEISLFENGEDLLAAWEPGRFQIVFMDIYLEGRDGIEICKVIRRSDPACVFILTTVSTDHGLQGFAIGATHYLLKPVRPNMLHDALERCRNQLEEYARYIEISENRVPVKILLRNLQYIEVFGNNCVIHAANREHTVYATLDSLMEHLEMPPFVRCHRSYAVNLHYVAQMEEKRFLLKDGVGIPVSRASRAQVRQCWDDFIGDSVRRNSALSLV